MRVKPIIGVPITPKQLVRQWATLPNKFAVNVWNFEIKAGKAAVSVFKDSFKMLKFNSSGEDPWRKRKRARNYPILNETHSLRDSIKWKHLGSKGASINGGVTIYTDPNGFKKTKRNRGFCYAAIHNDRTGTHFHGKSGSPLIQRQFMGHSTVLEAELKQLSSIIFNGFPQ